MQCSCLSTLQRCKRSRKWVSRKPNHINGSISMDAPFHSQCFKVAWIYWFKSQVCLLSTRHTGWMVNCRVLLYLIQIRLHPFVRVKIEMKRPQVKRHIIALPDYKQCSFFFFFFFTERSSCSLLIAGQMLCFLLQFQPVPILFLCACTERKDLGRAFPAELISKAIVSANLLLVNCIHS